MAAVTKAAKVKYMSQVANGELHIVKLATNVESGDQLLITGYDAEERVPVVSVAPVNSLDVDGMATETALAGDVTAMATHGLFGGFNGLTVRTPLYVSGTVAGGLDTTPPAGAPVSRVRAWTNQIVRIHC